MTKLVVSAAIWEFSWFFILNGEEPLLAILFFNRVLLWSLIVMIIFFKGFFGSKGSQVGVLKDN